MDAMISAIDPAPGSLVTSLRGIAIGVPDLDEAVRFYRDTWHLTPVAETSDAAWLRATGAAHHVLALHRASAASVASIDFTVPSIDALGELARRIPLHGGTIVAAPAPNPDPDGGQVLVARDPQGRVLRFVAGAARHDDDQPVRDRPTKITHVVLNSEDVQVAQAFFEQALGFRLSDRTRIMAFLRCSPDHHSIALADAQTNTLNHIAFLMPDLDSVMRGAGRMIDAGHPIEWGVGRHGPGNNVFAYFVGPADFVIEYTAEVGTVDDSYRVGGPDDWRWPTGRIDHWGIGVAPTERMRAAQRVIGFEPVPSHAPPTHPSPESS